MTRGRKRIERADPNPTRRRVTACPRGHEYTAENTYVNPITGARRCRACQHAWSNRAFRRKLYGLTLEQYKYLLEAQGGRCAICGTTDNSGVALGVDHDHKTGAVRGLLCDPCNVGIGGLRDDPALLASAIAYVERPRPVIPEIARPRAAEVCELCGEVAGVGARRREVDGRARRLCPSCWTKVGQGARASRSARSA